VLREFVAALALPHVVVYEHRDSIDCVPAGVDKGVALRTVIEAEGIRPEQTIAIGDGVNDIPMFAVAAHSIGVGRRPEVRAAATHSVDTIHEALELLDALLP